MANLIERHAQKIVGVLSCFDRLVLQETLPSVAYSQAMATELDRRGIRLFDYATQFAVPFREAIRAHRTCGVRGSELSEGRSHSADPGRAWPPSGAGPHLLAMEPCPTYEPWHDKKTGCTFIRRDRGKCLHYYFYFIDEMPGLCLLSVPTWCPFRALFYLNTRRAETQTWDFKAQLGFWTAPRAEREEAKLKFCELFAAFANADSGVFIVDVRDSDRALLGVPDVENRVKYTRQILDEYFGRTASFVTLQQIILRDDAGGDRSCLAVVVAQTHDAKSFTDVNGRWYPLRQEAGLVRLDDAEKINEARGSGRVTNFDFLQQLHRWSIDV